jgi:hypothetical protein
VRYFQQRVNVPGRATDLDRVRTIDFGNCFNGFIGSRVRMLASLSRSSLI